MLSEKCKSKQESSRDHPWFEPEAVRQCGGRKIELTRSQVDDAECALHFGVVLVQTRHGGELTADSSNALHTDSIQTGVGDLNERPQSGDANVATRVIHRAQEIRSNFQI